MVDDSITKLIKPVLIN